MELRNSLARYIPTEDQPHQRWVEQASVFISSAQVELRAGLGWVFDLGITTEMPFYQKKNLALINRVTFVSLLMALPGTFLLILMGFAHPFSLLVSGMLIGCLILVLNGAKRVEWSKILFAFTPVSLIVVFTLLELESAASADPLMYVLSRQGLCFGLLLPILIYGFEERRKIVGVFGICVLTYMVFEVASMRLGSFHGEALAGVSHGLFSLLSVGQYIMLAACIYFMQSYTMQHELETQKHTEKLHRLAIRDGMTGIFNHTFMEQYIADAINRSKRSRNPLALLMVDVDFFKRINDTFGHNAGDEVLKELVHILSTSTRSTDYLGRWGGDELVLLLTDTNLQGAANLAEKLRGLVAEHNFPHCQHLTISLGASVYRDGDTSVSLVERADASMYRSKRGGRNRVEVERSAVSYPQSAVGYPQSTISFQPSADSQTTEFAVEVEETAEKFY
jgi:diguanylate cyclase (GGDEF)-like protein